ncbi:hypothetical protein GH714_018814 [Hevea brasiliensis]|uniref:Uncharacterized protein n=1 Tax=Hevea brasiliensis TaxID=3981 RepID=A0A6A6L861_HEVBR|nr:hypothetical protein GH714_018814 [Hevea brasiliensis]
MQGSKVEQLWNGRKCPQQLKRLNLSESVHLRRLPNLSSATELEWISLQGCESLLEIPMSIQCLQKLVCLDLQGCKKLRSLPNLVQLKSLKELSLSYCSNLKMLPEIPIGIEELELEDCGLEGLPSSVPFLEDIYILKLRNCENLLSLPSSFHLKNVDALDLSGCSNLTKELYVDGTALVEIPIDIYAAECLHRLVLSGCSKLAKLRPLHDFSHLTLSYLDGTVLIEILIKRLNGRRSTIVMYHKRLHALPLNCTLMDTAGSYIVPIAECEELSGSYNVYNYCNSVNWDQNARGDIMVDALLRMKEISITSIIQIFSVEGENVWDPTIVFQRCAAQMQCKHKTKQVLITIWSNQARVPTSDGNRHQQEEKQGKLLPLDCITIIADGKSDYEEEEQPHPKRVK